MKVHDLKTWPVHFEPLARNEKTFELRLNDRGFALGDVLLLREWNPETERYTDRYVVRTISHMLVGAIQVASVGSIRRLRAGDWVILSLATPKVADAQAAVELLKAVTT